MQTVAELAVPAGYFHAPFGPLAVYDDGEFVTALSFGPHHCIGPRPTRLTCETVRQLRAYFAQPGFAFSLPVKPAGTAFQQRVWAALQQIPRGSVLTYGQLAEQLGSSARAVGGACRANPLPLIIPCHRVVASTGLGGYAGHTSGDTFDIKRWLLEFEQAAW